MASRVFSTIGTTIPWLQVPLVRIVWPRNSALTGSSHAPE